MKHSYFGAEHFISCEISTKKTSLKALFKTNVSLEYFFQYLIKKIFIYSKY